MPIARIQMPDGRVARLEVPEGTTAQQAEAFAFEQFHAPKADKPPAPRDAFDRSMIEAPTALEKFGRGFADITEGVQQRYLQAKDLVTGGDQASSFTKDKSEDIARYEAGRKKGATKLSDLITGKEADPGMDWWRLGGNVAATLPAGVGGAGRTMLARMLTGAAQGAAASGATFAEEGQSAGGNTILGGLIGGSVPVVGAGLRKGGNAILDKLGVGRQVEVASAPRLEGEIAIRLEKQGVSFAQLTQEVKDSLMKDAQNAVASGGTVDDAMLANKALIESVGAKGTRGSITRNPKDWQQEQDLRGVTGVGEPIAKRHQDDAAAMVNYLSGVRQQTGGKASDAYAAGESAITAIKTQDAAKSRAVDDLYTAYRESGLKGATVPEAKVMTALTNVIEEIGQDNLPAAVQGRLKEFGFLGGARSRYLTVDEADKFNRLLNANNPGHGPASKAVGMLRSGLNEALLETPGGGAGLTKAREAAAQRFAEQRAGAGIQAAVDNAAPDRFVRKYILDADARDVRGLWDELGKSAQGKQAQNDVRGHVVDTLLMKATGAKTLDDVAGSAFSYDRFASALNAIPSEKLHTIFSPSEMESLRRLERASKLLTKEVPFSDVNYSKTTTALANILQRVGSTPLLGQIVSPLIGAGTIGADWVKKAGERKLVAETLLGSAAKPGVKALPKAGLERFAPAPAAAALNPSGQRANE